MCGSDHPDETTPLDAFEERIARRIFADAPAGFEVRDHYVMRILDFAELLRAAWRAMD